MVPAATPTPKVVVREPKNEEEMTALALSFGLILSPISDYSTRACTRISSGASLWR